ncbi:MAG: penicillin acylase family protein [Rubrivivax sp.]|nr:penicillin acylase family protein [Rubrivivax sp.]
MKRLFKRLGLGLLGLLILLAAAAAVYAWRSLPALDGELKAPGLQQPLAIERDGADVTHIRAASARDAWFGIGYVHAQERGWQLEFNRRVMHGELSEVFGEATLETDKLMRTLGIVRAAQRQWEALPADVQQALQAYSDGINAFHKHSAQALSPEFHILGVKPGGAKGQPWSPVDSVGWQIMMALDLGGNWSTEFARLNAAQVLSTEQLWQLLPPYPGEAPASQLDFARLYAELGVYRKAPAPVPVPVKTGAAPTALWPSLVAEAIRPWADDFSANLGNVEGRGSNNWVVAGNHSKTGKPLLANDPHLGLSAPAIWYFARLQAPASAGMPALDVIGATLPGLPFVVLGRTAGVAWGYTNTGPDVQDLYLERIDPANPKRYQTPQGWAEFETRSETIKVKKAADVTLTVRSTRHGPVISDVQKSHTTLLDLDRYVIALRWSALDADNRSALAGMRSNQAQTVAELTAAYADYHSPMQNVVMADVSGAVAYKAIGKVPVRGQDNDIRGVAPAPGWDARYDWTGWLPYADTPQADHAAIAARGWLATANQRIHSADYPHFITSDWEPPYRQQRIEAMLAAQPLHDLASMQGVHKDELSLSTVKLLPYLRQSPTSHALGAAAQALLKDFDGVMRADSAAPLIFSVWTDEFTRGVLGAKLGQDRLMTMYGRRVLRPAIEGVLERDDKAWCGAAGCLAASGQALDRALARLQARYGADPAKWTWGAAHPALSAHRPFSNVGALAPFFDVRVATGGDRYTVNVGHFQVDQAKEPFANRHAASMRALYDLADLERSRFIYQTGQSGVVFSSRYGDMSRTWAAVDYRPLQLKPATIVHRLQLQP